MNPMLDPTTWHLNYDGNSRRAFNRRPPFPRVQSYNSTISNKSAGSDWDQTKLLDLSDSVRVVLRSDDIFDLDIGDLGNFLKAALKDHRRKHPTLALETIKYARLDKLLSELLQSAGTKHTSDLSPDLLLRFRLNVSQAKNLQQCWCRRFREQFFMLDQRRCAGLVERGRLKDVSFYSSLDYDLGKWQAMKVTGPVSEVEADMHFEPGHWWLNIACAERDGIVDSSLETPTKRCYGFTALPLLTGSEELARGNMVKYVREGHTSDMHISLISQVGRNIRILRGHRLKSIFAPEAGLRYDGLYTIRQYGFKFDSSTNNYRLELMLERAADQQPFEEISKIPKPSQLDDWALYEKLEGDKIRLLHGEPGYLEWKLERDGERADREEWQRARRLRDSISSGMASRGERPER